MNPVVLSWTNETALTPYPLVKSFGYDGLFIDANFIQFDGFVPVLNTIKVADDNIEITITFDSGPQVLVYTISSVSVIGTTKYVYDGDRYLGTLVFGNGVGRFLNNKGNQVTLAINIPFLSHTTKSISSTAGVYSIDGKYGNLQFTSDENINYEVDAGDITFNAIALPAVVNTNYLKTLNSVGPLDNSVFIKNTDIVKVTGSTPTVTISLVGSVPGGVTQTNAIIVTDG